MPARPATWPRPRPGPARRSCPSAPITSSTEQRAPPTTRTTPLTRSTSTAGPSWRARSGCWLRARAPACCAPPGSTGATGATSSRPSSRRRGGAHHFASWPTRSAARPSPPTWRTPSTCSCGGRPSGSSTRPTGGQPAATSRRAPSSARGWRSSPSAPRSPAVRRPDPPTARSPASGGRPPDSTPSGPGGRLWPSPSRAWADLPEGQGGVPTRAGSYACRSVREVLAAASHRPQTGATMRLRRVLLLLRRRLFAACAAATLLSPMVAALPPAITASAIISPTPNLTIVSTGAWTDVGRSPDLHLVGEVRNDDGTRAAGSIQVDCRLVNASETITYAERTVSTDAAILLPSETSPFEAVFQAPVPAYDHPKCAVSSVSTTQQPDHNFSFQ